MQALTAESHSRLGSSSATLDALMARVVEPGSVRASWHKPESLIHNRCGHRFAFSGKLSILGLERCESDGAFRAASDLIAAQGRDISAGGISFRHESPIPHRYVAISIRSSEGPETLVAKLTWCRYSRKGHYVSGGRFVTRPRLDPQMADDAGLIDPSAA